MVITMVIKSYDLSIRSARYYPAIELERIGAQFRQKLDATLNTLVLGLEISFSSGKLDGARQTVELLKKDNELALIVVG